MWYFCQLLAGRITSSASYSAESHLLVFRILLLQGGEDGLHGASWLLQRMHHFVFTPPPLQPTFVNG